jgi:hypothetical protein
MDDAPTQMIAIDSTCYYDAMVKKCKNDAMIYLARDDVVAAVTDPLGDEDAAAYIKVMSSAST